MGRSEAEQPEERGHAARAPSVVAVVLVSLALLAVGVASWQVTQMTECGGDGPSDADTAALAGYCDAELHYLALGVPGLVAAAGGMLGARRRRVMPFVVASGAGTLLALSPVVVAVALG